MRVTREHLQQVLADLEKGRDVLLHSLAKCQKIELMEGLTLDELESFEALTGRFARLSDMIIQKAFRTIDIVELEDAGTVRDRINRAEKKGIIENASEFVEIRILRNEIAHEYKSEVIYSMFQKVIALSPLLIQCVDHIISYAENKLVPIISGPQATSHEPRATSHKPRAMSHKPQATSHEPQAMSQKPINYLTVDVEDYFQVAAFEKNISSDSWDQYECRVVANTNAILELFAAHQVKATFFIVGWIAERYPEMVLEIDRQGHEIGCHSYQHRKIYDLTPEEFREDTRRSKEILERIIGKPVYGYRAPSYSITKKSLWALDILAELGFRYDSSIFPVYHDNYGIPDAPRFAYRLEEQDMMEYPISTVQFPGLNLPIAGGGYFRFFPYWFTRMALRRINRKDQQPFIFYFHPWEIDPRQPRIEGAGAKSRFRHYLNLNKTMSRLECLLQDFEFRPIAVETGF